MRLPFASMIFVNFFLCLVLVVNRESTNLIHCLGRRHLLASPPFLHGCPPRVVYLGRPISVGYGEDADLNGMGSTRSFVFRVFLVSCCSLSCLHCHLKMSHVQLFAFSVLFLISFIFSARLPCFALDIEIGPLRFTKIIEMILILFAINLSGWCG